MSKRNTESSDFLYHNNSTPTPMKIISSGNSNRSVRRLDATNVAMFADQLKYISPVVHEHIKAPLILFNLFPIEVINPGATMYEYHMFTSTGLASYSASKATDIPLVNRIGGQFYSKMGTLDIAMEISEGDIEASLFTNSNIIENLRNEAARSLHRTMENTLLNGYTPLGLKGLKNYDTGATAVPADWATATAAQIFDSVATAYNEVSNNTASLILPDTMLVSSTLYTILQTKPNLVGNTYTGTSVLQMIESTLDLKVIKVPALNKAFNNNTKDGFYLLSNKREHLVHPMAIMFDSTKPQEDGWAYRTYFRSKHGGLVSLHPKAIIARRMPD